MFNLPTYWVALQLCCVWVWSLGARSLSHDSDQTHKPRLRVNEICRHIEGMVKPGKTTFIVCILPGAVLVVSYAWHIPVHRERIPWLYHHYIPLYTVTISSRNIGSKRLFDGKGSFQTGNAGQKTTMLDMVLR